MSTQIYIIHGAGHFGAHSTWKWFSFFFSSSSRMQLLFICVNNINDDLFIDCHQLCHCFLLASFGCNFFCQMTSYLKIFFPYHPGFQVDPKPSMIASTVNPVLLQQLPCLQMFSKNVLPSYNISIPFPIILPLRNSLTWFAEMAHLLSTCTAPAKVLSSIPNTRTEWLTATCNYSCRKSKASGLRRDLYS